MSSRAIISAIDEDAWEGLSLVDTTVVERGDRIILNNNLAPVSVAGLDDIQQEGEIRQVINRGTQPVTFAAEDEAADPKDRFATATTLFAGKSAFFFYNGFRWEPVSPSGSSGGTSAWGDITGSLASQADLLAALNAKQAALVSGTNIKTVNSTSLLGSGNVAIAGDVETLASAYDNSLAAAISTIGADEKTVLIDAATTVSTDVVVPANVRLAFTNRAKIANGGTGSITFQGIGLTDPESRTPIFSGFTIDHDVMSNVNYQNPASAKIRWTGSEYPTRLSANLWDNAEMYIRAMNTIEAMSGRAATIVLYPGTYAHKVHLREGLSMHMTAGTYTATTLSWATSGDQFAFILEDSTTVYGDGQGRTLFVESPTNQRFFGASGMQIPSSPGPNNDIHVRDISFIGNPVTPFESSSSAVLLGNVTRGSVRFCDFINTHGFAIYIGGFSNADGLPYANGAWACDNYIEGLGTQYIGTVGGQNVFISRNHIIASQPPGTPFAAIIDIEPNTLTIGSENIQITDNIIDCRLAQAGVNGITVQRAYGGNLRNVRVAGNLVFDKDGNLGQFRDADINLSTDTITIYNHGYQTGQNVLIQGATLPTGFGDPTTAYGNVIAVTQHTFKIASSYANAIAGTAIDISSTGSDAYTITALGKLSYGIQCYSSQDLIIENNIVRGGGLSSLVISECYRPIVKGNILAWGNEGIRSEGTIKGVFQDNLIETDSLLPFGQGNNIIETDPTHNVSTTAGSPDIVVLGDKPLPWFFINGTVTIAGNTYSILERKSGSTGQTLRLSSNVPATSASVAATFNASSNLYIGNKVRSYTLMPASRVLSAADRIIQDSAAVAFSGTQNNYQPTRHAYRYDLTGSSTPILTGWTFANDPLYSPLVDGQKHLLYNAGSVSIDLVHESGSSTAAHRFASSTGATISLSAGQAAEIIYNKTLERWMTFKLN